MNKEILRKNIEHVIMQPCIASPWNTSCKEVKLNGLSDKGKYIMVTIRPDDSSCKFNLVDKDGNPIDYVEQILECLPKEYRDHLVTLKHENWISCSYVPVFDTDTQEMWDKELHLYYKKKEEWCDKYGCD